MNRIFCAFLAVAALSLNACQTHSHHQHLSGTSLCKADYPHLPCGSFSESLRAKCQTKPIWQKKFFWGNYGGPGCLGGEPKDELDWIFYRHDTAYLDGVKLRELREADRVLVRELKAVDPVKLTPVGQAYRKRAIRYFRNPISRWVGKPRDVLLRKKRAPTVDWAE